MRLFINLIAQKACLLSRDVIIKIGQSPKIYYNISKEELGRYAFIISVQWKVLISSCRHKTGVRLERCIFVKKKQRVLSTLLNLLTATLNGLG